MPTRPGIAVRLLTLALLAATLAGCFQGETGTRAPSPADPVRNQIVFTALQMVGVPYRYGGQSPAGFDCSGLVQYAYRNAGLSVPRTAREQLAASRPVAIADMQPGDLLFFRSKDWSHVGIWVGEGRFVHAPATGRTVSLAEFSDPWYQRNFVRAGRVHSACGESGSAAC